jgi:hypothetical protein
MSTAKDAGLLSELSAAPVAISMDQQLAFVGVAVPR